MMKQRIVLKKEQSSVLCQGRMYKMHKCAKIEKMLSGCTRDDTMETT